MLGEDRLEQQLDSLRRDLLGEGGDEEEEVEMMIEEWLVKVTPFFIYFTCVVRVIHELHPLVNLSVKSPYFLTAFFTLVIHGCICLFAHSLRHWMTARRNP